LVKTLYKAPYIKVRIFHRRSAAGCRTPVSTARRHTNPPQLLEWHFHFIREPIKKASEQYNFYYLNYMLILKTVPKETFYKSEQQ